MNFLSDCITYVRRIIKSPSDATISDDLIIDYINRFYINDVSAIMQLFDLKTTYQFQTTPGVCDYNMPLYGLQNENTISYYPVYQGFEGPAFANGFQLIFNTQRETFYNNYNLYVQALQQVAVGNGSTKTFQFTLPYFPAIPGNMDMSGMILAQQTVSPVFVPNGDLISVIPMTSVKSRVFLTYTDESGQNVVVQDSGQFLSNGTDSDLHGLLMQAGLPPNGGIPLGIDGTHPNGNYSVLNNTVNYNTGLVNVSFDETPPEGTPIQAQCYFYQQGLPRNLLFYNNTLTIMPPPNKQYLIELAGYLTPAAFFESTASIPFAYMTEYIARGAARKILSDTGDAEQLMFYEPFFKEQEALVWKRSQRIFTSTRTPTIFSQNQSYGSGSGQNTGAQ